jgi:hypothetical protein
MKTRLLMSIAAFAAVPMFVGSASAHDLCPYRKTLMFSSHVEHTQHGFIVRYASDCPVTPIRRTFRSKVSLECPAK